MASLYNSSTGVLKVNNLEASGNITATGNVTATGYGEFSNAYIGNLNQAKNWATVCHKKNKEKNDSFALIQNEPGHTVLNGAAGHGIEVKINNDYNQGFRLDKDGNITATGNINANGNVTAKGYGEFGNAHVGSATNWAEFSHKDHYYDKHKKWAPPTFGFYVTNGINESFNKKTKIVYGDKLDGSKKDERWSE